MVCVLSVGGRRRGTEGVALVPKPLRICSKVPVGFFRLFGIEINLVVVDSPAIFSRRIDFTSLSSVCGMAVLMPTCRLCSTFQTSEQTVNSNIASARWNNATRGQTRVDKHKPALKQWKVRHCPRKVVHVVRWVEISQTSFSQWV